MNQYPFASNWLDLGGFRLHYVDEGRGEPVVFVHGNPSWSFLWRRLIADLSATRRCIAIDHVGMGLSDKPGDDRYAYTLESRVRDLDALLAHLGIQEGVTLVAHDWGGMIASAWAGRHPSKVRRLVLMNTAAFFPPPTKALPATLNLARGPIGAFLVRGLNLFARGGVRWCVVRRPMAPDAAEGFLKPYDSWANRIAVHRFVQDIPVSPADPAWPVVLETQENLRKLSDVPMLIVWGGKDFVFDADFLAEWKRRFPRAEYVELPDAGHYVTEDAPAEVAKAVHSFFSSSRGTQHPARGTAALS